MTLPAQCETVDVSIPLEMRGWVDLKRRSTTHPHMARLPGHSLTLNEIKCFGCGACIAVCPIDVIQMMPPIVTIEERACTHCNLCIPACPVHALAIEGVHG